MIDDRLYQTTREHSAQIRRKHQRAFVGVLRARRERKEHAAFADVIPGEIERAVCIPPRDSKRAVHGTQVVMAKDGFPLIGALERLPIEPAAVEISDESPTIGRRSGDATHHATDSARWHG